MDDKDVIIARQQKETEELRALVVQLATCARQSQSVYQFFLNALQATLDPNLPYPALIPVNP